MDDAIDNKDWGAVLARLASNPHEAAIKIVTDGNYYGTPLHCALLYHYNSRDSMPVDVLNAFLDAYKGAVFEVDCTGDLPLFTAIVYDVSAELVKPLLEANPGAASLKNKDGEIPLHKSNDPEVVDLLLEAYPEGVGVASNDGWLPLHYAANNPYQSSLGILRALLNAGDTQNVGGVDGGGGVLVEDNEGKTPLMVACDMLPGDEDSKGLEKVYILARATYAALAKRSDNVIIDDSIPLLHAVVETNCPEFVILRTLSDNPNQTTVRDYRGRTPLAIAASQHNISPEIAKALLSTEHVGHTAAKMTDRERRLPLQLAAESGWDFESLESICQAAPEALERRDVGRTFLYPFMLAAEGPESNLNSTFQLLRASPKMARGMAEGIHWENSKLRLQCEHREQRELIAEQASTIAEQANENTMIRQENAKLREENAQQAKEISRLRELLQVEERHTSASSRQGEKKRKLEND